MRQRHVGGVHLAQRAGLVGASTTLYSCQPPMPTTLSPTWNFGERLSTTSPAVPPCITWPSGCGAA